MFMRLPTSVRVMARRPALPSGAVTVKSGAWVPTVSSCGLRKSMPSLCLSSVNSDIPALTTDPAGAERSLPLLTTPSPLHHRYIHHLAVERGGALAGAF